MPLRVGQRPLLRRESGASRAAVLGAPPQPHSRWSPPVAQGTLTYSVRAIPAEILAKASRLFWDVDFRALDPEKHEDFIVARVLVEGDWSCVRALRRELGDDGLAAFVRRAGARRLDRRTRRFFESVLDLPPCETTSSTPASAPLFLA
jgi:uncharacterized protein DUF6922